MGKRNEHLILQFDNQCFDLLGKSKVKSKVKVELIMNSLLSKLNYNNSEALNRFLKK